MRKKYRNEFHKLIENEGIDPKRFIVSDPEEKEGGIITEFCIKNSKLKFLVKNSSNSWERFQYSWTVFAPDFNSSRWAPAGAVCFFPQVKESFVSWIKNHVKLYLEELDEVSLWNNFQFESNIFDEFVEINIDERNTKFSQEEITDIKVSIQKLKQLIEDKYDLTEVQSTNISIKLDYAIESLERLNKFDWKSLFFSTISSIFVNIFVDTNTKTEFFSLIQIAFSIIKAKINY